MVNELLEAVIKLGLPVLGLSWWAIRRLSESGDIAPGADRRTVKSNLKEFRKKWRKNSKNGYNLIENKWMRFGGGFYGITALITLIFIELEELLSLLGNIPSIAEMFSDGLISFLVSILVNQIQNFVSALVWFSYWADGDRSIFVWIGVPYVSYLIGSHLASSFVADIEELEVDSQIGNTVEPKENDDLIGPG